ncbi:CRISPR-associated endonuclease Cas1 [Prevotella scopos JCM 17725]|uniref:CRISPR-associated endonuclease Cas1 n=1 Tax=Prevotella scopos JCM 17725 TaxID=1236518 RepID=A0AAX2F4H5_9BACT|nr:CRISPR-associated endonuclease Cas1 [Prevotella scopos]ANR74034.1 CRISPR-associated endonuclease Cas1 [Prevotella scopos JCM 17725]QUB44629.1 CRISPR-associated endonuclease Cas1 [Prevotella scopos JCM 17725]SHF91455.1 CRISPR-associated protein, Cas1 family [Prevotella scopos JCM 17725]
MELILNTFGVSLNRDNEGFVINTSEGKQRIPAVGIDSIQISRGAQITSDAVMLAIEHEIEVMFMDKTGKPIGRIWSPKYGSISTIRKGQLNFIYSHNAVDWIKEVLLKKIENQQALMLLFNNDDHPETDTEKNIARLEDYRNKIRTLDGDIVNDIAPMLRGWEGQASRIYFSTINAFLPEQFRFNIRSQHPALDITNAFLNYGYGILYGRIEGALIKAGVDPYIGVLHRDDYNRPVLVYDIIEMYRIWVDYVVYTLLAQNVITEEFYSVREDGSYWLEALGRRVLIQSLNDYMDEVITVKGVTRSRLTILSLYAQSLAQKFKEEM